MEKMFESAIRNLIEEHTDLLEELLQEALAAEPSDEDDGPVDAPNLTVHSIRTFDDAGILTTDKGIVIATKDGQRVFLTIQVQ